MHLVCKQCDRAARSLISDVERRWFLYLPEATVSTEAYHRNDVQGPNLTFSRPIP